MLTLPVERIEQKAREADPRRALMTALVFLPYVLGWTARKVWMGLAFAWLAVGTGWREAGGERQEAAPRNPYGGR